MSAASERVTPKRKPVRLTYTPNQAAQVLGVSASTVRRLCEEGSIPHVRTSKLPGARILIGKQVLSDWVNSGGLLAASSSCPDGHETAPATATNGNQGFRNQPGRTPRPATSRRG